MSGWVRYLMGLVSAVLVCLASVAAEGKGMHAATGVQGVSSSRGDVLLRVDQILGVGNPSAARSLETRVVRRGVSRRSQATTETPVVQAAVGSETRQADDSALAGTVSGSPGKRLLRARLSPDVPPEGASTDAANLSRPPLSPSLLEREQVKDVLMPEAHLRSVGNLPGTLTDKVEGTDRSFLAIQVSHSAHELKLLRMEPSGKSEVLHECRVGLGDPASFPTPIGTYFVTHIYDRDPWWIPPPNRAWAAGQSPSKKVYGGTMAPLLKKRSVRVRGKHTVPAEDKIEGSVRLEDYGYRFHGTNAPRSIGHNQSHGCVRMLPADAKQVAALIESNIGVKDRKESVNGSFVILKAPVRLNLIK